MPTATLARFVSVTARSSERRIAGAAFDFKRKFPEIGNK